MATRVSGPESTAPDVAPEHVHYRDTGGSLVNPIGPGFLDSARIAAREAVYGNSQQERETVFAADQAAFDKVQALEQFLVDRAEGFIDSVTREGSETVRPGIITATESVVTRLNGLVTELERGVPASQLAERFKDLQNEATHAALPKLLRAKQAIEETHLPNMEDPYGATQRAISKMPRSSARPIDPQRYIRR